MRVLFVCLGNICRSPMAEAVFVAQARVRGAGDRFEVDSAGTAAYHAGEPPDPRTVDELRRHGIVHPMTARAVVPEDFERFDHVLAMDASNFAALERIRPAQAKGSLHKMLAPIGGGDVPDPYYGGTDGFAHVYDLVLRASDAWLDQWLPSDGQASD